MNPNGSPVRPVSNNRIPAKRFGVTPFKTSKPLKNGAGISVSGKRVKSSLCLKALRRAYSPVWSLARVRLRLVGHERFIGKNQTHQRQNAGGSTPTFDHDSS